jgi:proteasome assembly chaperone (PAC2) family protein
MSNDYELWEKPEGKEIYLVAGWRQWADAGSISSALPQYLIKKTNARQIGAIRREGFYLFQFPGTHDLVRPVVKFDEGYPEDLQVRRNEFYCAEIGEKSLVIFTGDEPHMDVERYVGAFLDAIEEMGVKRIVGFGGVYGELPYDKDRMVSSIYSLGHLKDELTDLAVSLSDYQGGASIGSYICKRAGERGLEYFSFYAFVPTYDFSSIAQLGNMIRIENDYMAWFGVMRRVNHLLKLDFDLTDLERKSERLIKLVDAKVEELETSAPDNGVREYLDQLSASFTEVSFDPLGEIWEEELRRLDDKFEDVDEMNDE